MKSIKSVCIIILISFAMIWTGAPAISYAQWLNTPDNNATPDISQELQNSTDMEEESIKDNSQDNNNLDEQYLDNSKDNEITSEEPMDKTQDNEDTNNIEDKELPDNSESTSTNDDANLQKDNKVNITIFFMLNNSNKELAKLQYTALVGDNVDFTSDVDYTLKELEKKNYFEVSRDEVSFVVQSPAKENSINLYVYCQDKSPSPDDKEPTQNTQPNQNNEPDPNSIEFKIPVNYYNIYEVTGKSISKPKTLYYETYENIYDDIDKLQNNPSAFIGTFDNYVYHHTIVIYYCDGSIDVVSFFGDANAKGQYTIKINYLEEGTNKVLADSFVSQKIANGQSYNVSTLANRNILGYQAVKTVGATKGVINNKNVEINVYYKKVTQYYVTVNYIDYNKKQNIIEPFVSVKINSGETYDFSKYDALKINGYKYYMTSGDPVKGTLDKNKVINVYYVKNGEEVVNTGDDSVLKWMVITVIAIVVLAILVIFRRARK